MPSHRVLGFEVAAGWLLALIVLVTSRERLLLDPGTFWHTAAGDRLLREGFTTDDAWSFTMRGSEWIPSQWLAEVAMAGLHRLAGMDGWLFGTAAVLAAVHGLVGGRLVRAGCHPLLAFLGVGLLFTGSCYHFHARPHLATFALLATLFALLVDIEAGRTSPRRLPWLFPLFVLWTNLHGGMLAGWLTLVMASAGWMIWGAWGRPTPLADGTSRGLALVTVCLAGLAVLINPYGLGLPRMWLKVLSLDLPNIVTEHAPLPWTEPEGLAVLAVAAVYLFLLAGTWPRWPRFTWLLPLVWLYLAIDRVRNGPLFAVVALLAAAELLPYCRWTQWLAKRSDLYVVPPAAPSAPLPLRWLLAARLAPIGLLAVPLLTGPGWAVLDAKHWPVELVDDLRELARSPSTRLFHQDLHGGFLIHFVPGLPVFFDDRFELYGAAFLSEYADAYRQHPERIADWTVRYGLTHALVGTQPKVGGKFLTYLRQSPDWQMVKTTDAATLFRRLPP